MSESLPEPSASATYPDGVLRRLFDCRIKMRWWPNANSVTATPMFVNDGVERDFAEWKEWVVTVAESPTPDPAQQERKSK